MAPQLTNVLVSTSSAAGLWILFHWIYRDYRKDLLQNRLFELRQELFDTALYGRLDFDHPAYGVLRSTINGFIRDGFRLNLVGFFAFLMIFNPRDLDGRENYVDRLLRLSSDLPEETQKELLHLLHRLNWFILAHVVLTSLPLAVVALPIYSILSIAQVLRLPEFTSWIKRTCSLSSLTVVDRIDNAALAVGGGSVALSPSYAPPSRAYVRTA